MKRSGLLVTSAIVTCVAGLSSPLHAADTWPNRPLRFILPSQSGASADIAARALSQQLAKTWKQPVVVDNRPGAGTIVGTHALAGAPPDGHTFAWVLAAHATNPALYSKLPYDTLRDIAGVTLLYSLRSLITAAPGLPANNVTELVAMAKSRPGRMTFTSPLPGTVPHLIGELFKRKEKLQMEHIGYKGGLAAHADVMTGRVPVMFDVLPNALPQIRARRLKALAVIGEKPAKELPGVPVLAGLLPPDALAGWNGIMVPARTPADIVSKLNADFIAAARSPAVQARFNNLTVDTVTTTPAEFDAFIRREMQFWGDVVRTAGIRLD